MIEGTKTVICGLTREATPEILKWVNDPALNHIQVRYIRYPNLNTRIG